MRLPPCVTALSRRAFNELDAASQARFKGRIIESSHVRLARFDDPERCQSLRDITDRYNRQFSTR